MTWEEILAGGGDSVGAGVVTVGEARQLIARIDSDIRQLDDAIAASNVSKQFRRAWGQFKSSWRNFFFEEKDHPSRTAARTALMFVSEARQWRQALAREKASRVSGDAISGIGGPRVDALTRAVATAEQARALLDAAEKHLRAAWERTAQISLVASAAGLRQALRDGVENVRNWAAKVRAQLPPAGALGDETLRRKVALAVVQAEDQLRRVDESVNDPELRFWPNFAASLKQIATTAQSGLPWKPVLLGMGGLLVLGAVLGRRVP
jgi:hypothetical protein